MRIFLIVLDSVGIGSAPDANIYGDEGAATLQHTAKATGGLKLPFLASLGLGNIPDLIGQDQIHGVAPHPQPLASYGAMQEVSQGKDTITGHWEIAGLKLVPGFHLFPDTVPAFPAEITAPFIQRTGRPILGNKHGSGTAIIDELGQQSIEKEAFIVYTSADSVFQIAAHKDVIPLDELYNACTIARELCDPYRVGRVIARPFIGEPGTFTRTKERKDFSYQTKEPTLLQHVSHSGIPVYAIGKIEDIFAHKGITTSWHTGGNPSSMAQTMACLDEVSEGLIFANYIDFDMLYGHRRDPEGYARCLEETDQFLSEFVPKLTSEDVLIITADHGNDPTFKGTDHTREYVPLLVYQPDQPARNLGVRNGFFDIAQSIATCFSLPPMQRGQSFM